MGAKSEDVKRPRYEYNVSSEYDGAPYHAVTPNAIWKGLREKTSAHGVPHVDNAQGK